MPEGLERVRDSRISTENLRPALRTLSLAESNFVKNK